MEDRVVYTDGACEHNQTPSKRRAGVGVWFGERHPYNVSRRPFGMDTNNQAELEAILDAVQIIRTRLDPTCKYHWILKTDSNYSVKCITQYWPSWERRGGMKSDGKPAIHYDLVTNIVKILRGRPDHITLKYIPREENEYADTLAKEGRSKEKV